MTGKMSAQVAIFRAFPTPGASCNGTVNPIDVAEMTVFQVSSDRSLSTSVHFATYAGLGHAFNLQRNQVGGCNPGKQDGWDLEFSTLGTSDRFRTWTGFGGLIDAGSMA
jgi:hypothetical protein